MSKVISNVTVKLETNKLPAFPPPLFVSDLEDPDPLPTFVSKYQLPLFDPDPLPTFVSKYQLPLFVSELEKPIIFTDDSTIASEDPRQSTVVPIYRKGNYNKLDDRLFELNSIVNGIPCEVVIQEYGSLKTKRSNRRRTQKRRLKKELKKTSTRMEELPDHKFINYLSKLMAQVDASIQAELEKIRNDDYGC